MIKTTNTENYSYSGSYKTIAKVLDKHLGQLKTDNDTIVYTADWVDNKPIITNISISGDCEYFNISFKDGTGLNVQLTDVIKLNISKEYFSEDNTKIFAERYTFNTENKEFTISGFGVKGLLN